LVLPRFHIGRELMLAPGAVCELPQDASRHVQVLRMQPGGQVQLFDGCGGEWLATVTEMGRKVVTVCVGEAIDVQRELPVAVTLAMGMPANDRMDALVEKAAELGVLAIQPLMCERSVLRLDGERAAKKVAHWQAVAVSACEQSGRAVVPQVHEVMTLSAWLKGHAGAVPGLRRGVLSLREAVSMRAWLQAGGARGTVADAGDRMAERHEESSRADSGCAAADISAKGRQDAAAPEPDQYVFLSGPEGGLSPAEEAMALSAGWTAITLGPRVLRADTAPLAALSVIGSVYEG
jgi:16S rRNA (uracil1498-N3)-methyltransferase